MSIHRRGLLGFAGAAAVQVGTARAQAACEGGDAPGPASPDWPPTRVPMGQVSLVKANGLEFFCRDTGGPGEAVVLLHPATGSSEVWGYQQPEFSRAGYRVVAYSRRGFRGSSPLDDAAPGDAGADLEAVADALGLDRFHLVGSAAGGFVVSDFALGRPERLLSMTIASSFAGIVEPEYRAALDRLKPPGFDDLPAAFRELGPSYRAGNPEGVGVWEALEREATNGVRVRQPLANRLTWAAVESIRTPTLILTGDADLYMPPHMMRVLAAHYAGCRTAVIPDCGHSAYWEQPALFNRTVLAFLAANRAGSA